MLKERSDVLLHCFKLIQLQIGVDNREQIPRSRLFIHENPLSIAYYLFFDFQQALAFKHHGGDIASRNVTRFVELDQLAQQRLGSFLLDWLAGRRRCFIYPLPIGNKAFAVTPTFAELFLPAAAADIGSTERRLLVEK